MSGLHEIHVRGFKSIRDQKLQFNPLNVIIGANGAGKSNLVEVFRLLRRVAGRQLQTYTGESGGANAILYFGRKVTEKLELRVEFRSGAGANIYAFELKPTSEDRFIFEQEQTFFHDTTHYPEPYNDESWSGHSEARVSESTRKIAG